MPERGDELDAALDLLESSLGIERRSRSPFEQVEHDEVGRRLLAEGAADPKPSTPSRDELQASVGADVDLDDPENLEWAQEQCQADRFLSRFDRTAARHERVKRQVRAELRRSLPSVLLAQVRTMPQPRSMPRAREHAPRRTRRSTRAGPTRPRPPDLGDDLLDHLREVES